jgi:hypothetical protein
MVKSEYMRPDYRVFLPAKLFTIHILLFTDTLFHVEHRLHRRSQGDLFHVEQSMLDKILAHAILAANRLGTVYPRSECCDDAMHCFTWNQVNDSPAT